MRSLEIRRPSEPLSVLCLGAHSDDIEIGIGGTVLQWLSEGAELNVAWCVLSAVGPRKSEARASAADFLSGAERSRVELHAFRDGYFPAQSAELKAYFEEMKTRIEPDVIFTHRHDDAHQDHRETCRHTWNTFRDHMIFEYEVPKWDGDVGRPNLYVPLQERVMARKIELLNQHFVTQRGKHWFDEETFRGLARLRGMECRAKDRYAEGLFAHKLLLR
jgi:LmbE family N-acetylglucosaminyl deacetylase